MPIANPDWIVLIKKNANGDLEATPGTIRPHRGETVVFFSVGADVVICFDSYTCFGLHRFRIPRNTGVLVEVVDWAPNAEDRYEMVEYNTDPSKGDPNPPCGCNHVDWREYAFDLMEHFYRPPYTGEDPKWPGDPGRTDDQDVMGLTAIARVGKPRNP